MAKRCFCFFFPCWTLRRRRSSSRRRRRRSLRPLLHRGCRGEAGGRGEGGRGGEGGGRALGAGQGRKGGEIRAGAARQGGREGDGKVEGGAAESTHGEAGRAAPGGPEMGLGPLCPPLVHHAGQPLLARDGRCSAPAGSRGRRRHCDLGSIVASHNPGARHELRGRG